ncbi:uncharacterized protein VTP21DRAFT_10052 [Calcarisporiella thermophila]|uniref:uncharacterized protein n=1 Tax=Calcarisporiella thermophila TaxID=911321 RepID=UPI003743739B
MNITSIGLFRSLSFGRHSCRAIFSAPTPRGVRFYSENSQKNNNEDGKNENSQSQLATDQTKTENKANEIDERITLLEAQVAEWKDKYIRSLAEMENVRQRTRKEMEQVSEYAIQKFAKDLLETVDILGLALRSVPEQARTDNSPANANLRDLYTGLSMTETELIKTLRRHGVEPYGKEGEIFDPNVHQALYQSPVPDKEVGTVFRVEKPGYMLKGRILRPAQVGVVAEATSA